MERYAETEAVQRLFAMVRLGAAYRLCSGRVPKGRTRELIKEEPFNCGSSLLFAFSLIHSCGNIRPQRLA
jgi:hypothetical protein